MDPQTAQQWLEDFFEYESCGECGWGLDQHTVGPDPLGNRHAWCDDPIPEDWSDAHQLAELNRRLAISTS